MKCKPMLYAPALVLIALVALAGCATVPKESVELSTELTKMIRSAESSHLAVVEEYISEKRHRADDFLERIWIPDFMEGGMKDTKLLDLVAAEKDPTKKASLLLEYNQDAAVEIAKRRASIMSALDEVGSSLRDAVRDHYSEMLAINQALTANLKSASDVDKTRGELFAALKIDPKAIVPLDKINGVLEKILKNKGVVDNLPQYIEEARNLLKGR